MKAIEKDILIIGAGASGLACATRLREGGIKSLAILEARKRVGGRVHTRWQNSYPLEMGPEFIHGAPRFTLDLLEKNRIPFFDVDVPHVEMRAGKSSEAPFESIFAEVGPRLDPKRDLSVVDFLNKQNDFSDNTKKLLKTFVEGFHAADANVMGERALHLAGEANEGELNGVEMFRLPLGYSQLFKTLAKDLEIHLETIVKKISWIKGKVEVTTADGQLWHSKKVIVTLPLSLLKANAVELTPKPVGYEDALGELRMGHVQRLWFIFKTRFWESLSEDRVGFLHSPSGDFPVWWTTSPMRTPYMVAWQGGPRAEAMAEWSLRERAEAGIKTLSAMTGLAPEKITKQIIRVRSHNWSKDIYTQGAYSYMARNSQDKWHRLQKDFDKTLYFAGEAFADGPERGTVHGALHSGLNTAEAILGK